MDITSCSPKINLLYYKNILNNCFVKFFKDFNNDFSKEGDIYIYANTLPKPKLQEIFTTYIVDELKGYITTKSMIAPNYYFIIGGCYPAKNILLDVREDEYFPEKLTAFISSDYPVKYVLKEKDLRLDLVLFNDIVDKIFVMFFKSRPKIIKWFGKDYDNLFFIRHDRLSCYSVFKIIKFLLGKKNCVNLYKEKFIEAGSPLIAINDVIDKYSTSKSKVTRLPEFKNILSEIEQYINECLQRII